MSLPSNLKLNPPPSIPPAFSLYKITPHIFIVACGIVHYSTVQISSSPLTLSATDLTEPHPAIVEPACQSSISHCPCVSTPSLQASLSIDPDVVEKVVLGAPNDAGLQTTPG